MGSSVQATSSPLLASESNKTRLEAGNKLDRDDIDFFSDSESSSHSELGSENEEIESADTKKVSAAPASLKGHDSDNDSDKNDNDGSHKCLDCDSLEEYCVCDGQKPPAGIPKKAQSADEANILSYNIEYVETSVLPLPRGVDGAYVIDENPWANASTDKKWVYTNDKGKDMTVEGVAHKFKTTKECMYKDFYAPLLLRAKNQGNNANEKTFLLCRFERHSQKWQAMLLDLDDGKTEYRMSPSNLHNYERVADQTWHEDYGDEVHELLKQNIKPFQRTEVIEIDDGLPTSATTSAAGTRRTSRRVRSASETSFETCSGTTSTGSTTKARKPKVPSAKQKTTNKNNNNSTATKKKGKAKRTSRNDGTFDPVMNLTLQAEYISDDEVESRTCAAEKQLSRKVQKLEEQILREREETKNVMREMTEQLNRLQKVHAEQQGTFLPPGPAAASHPPQLAYQPYQPRYQSGPPHHPLVGEAVQNPQMPQGYPFAPVNKYYTFY